MKEKKSKQLEQFEFHCIALLTSLKTAHTHTRSRILLFVDNEIKQNENIVLLRVKQTKIATITTTHTTNNCF